MKKIITLVLCSVILTSAFAQRNRHDRTDDENYSVYQNSHRRIDERNRMIQKISYQYDFRISQVKNDRSMSHRERKYMVKRIEAEKAQQINRIYAERNNSAVYNYQGDYNYDYKNNGVYREKSRNK